jgi:hypothetical protein
VGDGQARAGGVAVSEVVEVTVLLLDELDEPFSTSRNRDEIPRPMGPSMPLVEPRVTPTFRDDLSLALAQAKANRHLQYGPADGSNEEKS